MPRQRRIALALQIDEPYPHHQDTFSGILSYAKQCGNWECVIDEYPVSDARRKLEHTKQYDGVIARAFPRLLRRLKRTKIPLVNVLYHSSGPGLAGVYADPWAIGRLAADHLMDRGFRRLSILVDRRHRHSWDISLGFVRRATERAVTCSVHELPEESYDDPVYWMSMEVNLNAVMKVIRPPVAVFTETAPVARLMAQLAKARNWRVPQDMAILCAHNLEAVVNVSPQISTIDRNYALVGYEAAALLDRLMSEKRSSLKSIYVPPSGIIARESTDYYAVDDKIVAAALRFISERLSKPLKLKDIASAVMVSSRLLQRRFQECLGRGVSNEIRRLRIEAAKRMLAEPDRQISEVATLCGFRNSDIMGQVFRREVGTTPSKYRRQLSGKKSSSK